MTKTYIMNERGMVGVTSLPDWINFDEFPPRSFEVTWLSKEGGVYTGLAHSNKITRITKEVADIVRSLKT